MDGRVGTLAEAAQLVSSHGVSPGRSLRAPSVVEALASGPSSLGCTLANRMGVD